MWLSWPVVTLALIGVYLGVTVRQNWRRDGEPPVVWSWIPWLGSALAFGNAPIAFLRAQALVHGPTFVVVIAGKRTVHVTDPKHWSKLVRQRPGLIFDHTPILLNAFGVSEVNQKRLTPHMLKEHAPFTSLMNRDKITEMTVSARAAFEDMFDKMLGASDAEPSEHLLFDVLRFPFFSGTMKMLFGEELATQECFDEFTEYDDKFGMLVAGTPMSVFPKTKQALTSFAARFRCAQCYATPDAPASGLMRARRAMLNECYPLDHPTEDIHGRMQFTFVWASNANTLPTSCWILFYFLKAKAKGEDQTALMREIASVSTLESYDAMPVFDSYIDETLRLHSSSILARRIVVDDFTLPDGLTLRRCDEIMMFSRLALMDEEAVGADVNTFRPERYIETPDHPKVHVPIGVFGGGEHMCPGRNIARRALKVFVVALLDRFDVSLVDSDEPTPTANTTRVGLGIMAPITDVRVLFTPIRKKAD